MKLNSKTKKRSLAAALVAMVSGIVAWIAIAGTGGGVNISATLTDSIDDTNGTMPNVAEPTETINYTATLANSGSATGTNVTYDTNVDGNTTLVAGSVKATPLAFDDAYSCIGNVGLNVPAGSGVLANDTDPDGVLPANAVTSTGVIATLPASSGSVNLAADGSFTYDPAPGFTGNASFSYAIADSDGLADVSTGTGVVEVTISVSGMIWFIDSAAPAGGNGTLASPFNTLAQHNANSLDSDGDCIFLASGSYSGTGITLQNNQVLVGQGSTTTLAASCGLTVPTSSKALPSTGGVRPTITSSADGISLASANTIRGLDIGNTGAANDGIAGSSVGDLTVDEVAISGTGGGVNLTGPGNLSVTFDSISSSGSDNGIRLDSTNGSFTVSGNGATTTFTQPVAGGSVPVLARNGSGGTISSSGPGVRLLGSTGVTLRQMSISSSGSDCIDLDSGAGDFTFSALDIDPGVGHGIDINDFTGNGIIDNGTRIHDFDTTQTHAVNVRNANTNMGLLTIENSIIENQASTNGAVAIDFDSTGSSQMAVNIDDCLFSNLYGDAILISPGQALGSTGTTTANIRQNRFQNAQAAGGNGLSGVLFGCSNEANLIYTFDDNEVDNVGLGGAVAWVIASLAQNSGEINGAKTNNSISNISDRGAIAFRSVQSSVVGNGVVDGRINNNTITGVGRQCVFMDVFNDSPNFDAEVRNNTLGTLAAPVGFANFLGGFSAIEVNYAYDAQLDLHIDENTVRANAVQETRLNFLGMISVWNDDLDMGTENGFARVNMTGNDVSNTNTMFEYHADSFAGNTQLDAHIDDNNTAAGFPSPVIDIYEEVDDATQIHLLGSLASRNNSATITDFSNSTDNAAGDPALGSPPPLPTFVFPAP